jgi:hypothetical protein
MSEPQGKRIIQDLLRSMSTPANNTMEIARRFGEFMKSRLYFLEMPMETFADRVNMELELVEDILDGLLPLRLIDDSLIVKMASVINLHPDHLRILLDREEQEIDQTDDVIEEVASQHQIAEPEVYFETLPEVFLSSQPTTIGARFISTLKGYMQRLRAFVVRELELRTQYPATQFELNLCLMTDLSDPVFFSQTRSLSPRWLGDVNEGRKVHSIRDIFDLSGQRLVVLGAPGSGKTTLMLRWLLSKIEEAQTTNHFVPVYAPVSTWDGRSTLIEWLTQITELNNEFVTTAFNQQRMLLVVDGVDEIMSRGNTPRERKDDQYLALQSMLQDAAKSVSMICISRTEDYRQVVKRSGVKLPGEQAVRIEMMTDLQLCEAVKYQRELGFVIDGDPQLREMVRNPLMLALWSVAVRELGEESYRLWDLYSCRSSLRHQVFEQLVKRRYEHEQQRSSQTLFSQSQFLELMSYLAHLTTDSGIKLRNLHRLWKQEEAISSKYSLKQLNLLIQFAEKLSMLQVIDKRTVSFSHPLLREYFMSWGKGKKRRKGSSFLKSVRHASNTIYGIDKVKTLYRKNIHQSVLYFHRLRCRHAKKRQPQQMRADQKINEEVYPNPQPVVGRSRVYSDLLFRTACDYNYLSNEKG